MEKRSKEDVFFRNSSIEEEFRKVVASLSDAVSEGLEQSELIETDTEKVERWVT